MPSKSSPDAHDVTVSIVQLVVLTALATSFYTKMSCIDFGEVLHDVSYLRRT